MADTGAGLTEDGEIMGIRKKEKKTDRQSERVTRKKRLQQRGLETEWTLIL